MTINLGDDFADFEANSHKGPIKWHEFIDGCWAILFSHPADYTPVCTTELGSLQYMQAEFEKRGVKCAALSCNDTASHVGWVSDILAVNGLSGSDVFFPIIADPERRLAESLGCVNCSAQVRGRGQHRERQIDRMARARTRTW